MIEKNTYLLLISLFLLLNLFACETKPEEEGKPNVIIIYADDLGYGDLTSYGGDIPTPNIDSIGMAGIRFTEFYVGSPACTPSRYSLLTGGYPQRSQHGLERVIMPGDDRHFDEDELLLPELLKKEGYFTGVMGKWHLGSLFGSYLPMFHGFDRFSGMPGGVVDYFTHVYGPMGHDWMVDGRAAIEEGYSTDLITNHALNFLQEAKGKDDPFFLYLAYTAPHYGKTDPDTIPDSTVVMHDGSFDKYRVMNTLQAPAEYVEKFSHVEDPYRKMYSAMVASLDDNIGKVMTQLKADGMLDNTIVWFISDNGGYSESYFGHSSNGDLRGEKGTLWEGGIRIPAMMFWKGKIEPNQVVSDVICNVDVVPTLGNIIGYADTLANFPIDGVDISPVLFDHQPLERDVFWCYYDHQSAFRRGDWKLMNGYELYNLADDMSEEHNVADQYPEKLQELKNAFEAMDSTIVEEAVAKLLNKQE